jgi:hypothetical protein
MGHDNHDMVSTRCHLQQNNLIRSHARLILRNIARKKTCLGNRAGLFAGFP